MATARENAPTAVTYSRKKPACQAHWGKPSTPPAVPPVSRHHHVSAPALPTVARPNNVEFLSFGDYPVRNRGERVSDEFWGDAYSYDN